MNVRCFMTRTSHQWHAVGKVQARPNWNSVGVSAIKGFAYMDIEEIFIHHHLKISMARSCFLAILTLERKITRFWSGHGGYLPLLEKFASNRRDILAAITLDEIRRWNVKVTTLTRFWALLRQREHLALYSVAKQPWNSAAACHLVSVP